MNRTALALSFLSGAISFGTTLMLLFIASHFDVQIRSVWFTRVVRADIWLTVIFAIAFSVLMLILVYFYFSLTPPRSRLFAPLLLFMGSITVARQIAAIQAIDLWRSNLRTRFSTVRNPSVTIAISLLAVVTLSGLCWLIFTMVSRGKRERAP